MRKQFDVNSMLKGLHGKLGDEDYIEPLEILINSLNQHNKFNRFGKIAFKSRSVWTTFLPLVNPQR